MCQLVALEVNEHIAAQQAIVENQINIEDLKLEKVPAKFRYLISTGSSTVASFSRIALYPPIRFCSP
jgi:hypothetical protein